MRNVRRLAIGVGFVIAALLGSVCVAIIVGVVIQLIRDSQLFGKDFVAIPLFALLAFLLLKAVRDLWLKLRSR